MPSQIQESIPPQQKRDAVDVVLRSKTFARCDQLKHFLNYVAEQEMNGQADSITEYLIGVKALGRPEDFVPTEDSSVRSRAHALRKKLDEFYHDEAAGAEIRVYLPKGSYTPQFIRKEPKAEPPTAIVAQQVAIFDRIDPVPRSLLHAARWLWPGALGFIAGALCLAACCWIFRQPLSVALLRVAMPAVIGDAWGPLVARDAEALLVVATPAQMFLRDFQDMPLPRDPVWAPEVQMEPRLLQWYSHVNPVTPRTKLLFQPNSNSPLWGDAAAAQEAADLLSSYAVSHQLVREHLIKPYMLRGRNVMLFGRAEYSDAIRLAMADLPFQIEYRPDLRWHVIANKRPRQGEKDYYDQRGLEDENLRDVYGLLTVLPNDGTSGSPKRMVIFSGLNSAGSQAAQEFFASPSCLADLSGRLRKEGYKSWPPAYQVVIRVHTDQTLPMQFFYETHRVVTVQ